MGVGRTAWHSDSNLGTTDAAWCKQTVGSTHYRRRICQVWVENLVWIKFNCTWSGFVSVIDTSLLRIFWYIIYLFCFFISLVTGCCYKFLENPTSVKNGTTKDLIFNLLGVMVKKYNYGLGESNFYNSELWI